MTQSFDTTKTLLTESEKHIFANALEQNRIDNRVLLQMLGDDELTKEEKRDILLQEIIEPQKAREAQLKDIPPPPIPLAPPEPELQSSYEDWARPLPKKPSY